MSKLNLCGFKPDPKPPAPPELGTRGTWRFRIEDDHPRLKPGTITYITFDGGLRQCYHFGEA